MNFDFSEDDQMVRDQATRLLADSCGLDVVRKVLEGEAQAADPVWKGLGEMGLMGTAIPETYGGSGAGYLPLCLVAQEVGAALAPVAFSSTVYLVAEALLQFGTEAQKASGFPRSPVANLKAHSLL